MLLINAGISTESISLAPKLAKEEIYKMLSGPPELEIIEIPQPNNGVYLFKYGTDSANARDSHAFYGRKVKFEVCLGLL